MVKLTQEMQASRVSEDDLRPIIEHFAKAASHSQEAFLELAMAMPHIKRVMPEWEKAVGHLVTGAYQSWQTLEQAGDDVLGPEIISLRAVTPEEYAAAHSTPEIEAERV